MSIFFRSHLSMLAMLAALLLGWASCSSDDDGGEGEAEGEDMGPMDAGDGPADGMHGEEEVSGRDFNGDGFDDVLVGAPDGMLTGYVHVYFGGSGATLEATPDGVLIGATNGDRFGKSVAPAGDFNGDGYADIIVGSPGSGLGGGQNAGRVDVFFGGPDATLDDESDWMFLGAAEDWLGHSVAGLGDVNGDGYADIIVGAPGDPGGSGAGSGKALVFFGGEIPDETPDGTIDGTAVGGAAAGAAIGFSVSGGTDVNGDGVPDVVVGAPAPSAVATAEGNAYVFFGGAGASLDTTPDGTLFGQAQGERFGLAVLGLGDTNGDGLGDVAVGAENAGGGIGRVDVFFGGEAGTFDAVPEGSLNGPVGAGFLGGSLGSGDFDGDGLFDLAVGARFTSEEALIFLGEEGAQFDETSDGAMAGLGIKTVAGTVGDVNGDGYDEVIVGAPASDTVFVYFGGDPLDLLTPEATLAGTANDQYGDAVAAAHPATRGMMCLMPMDRVPGG